MKELNDNKLLRMKELRRSNLEKISWPYRERKLEIKIS